MPTAEITYNAGLSYDLVRPNKPTVKFKKNKTVTTSSADVIERCSVTRGFTVRVLDRAPAVPEKKVRKVEHASPGPKKKVRRRSRDA